MISMIKESTIWLGKSVLAKSFMGFAKTSSKYVTFFSSTINLQKSDAIFTIGCSKDNNKEEIMNLCNLL